MTRFPLFGAEIQKMSYRFHDKGETILFEIEEKVFDPRYDIMM